LKLRHWITALRAHFLTVTVAPVLIGTATAWYQEGRFNALRFLLALAGASLIHLGANMSNDFFDARSEADARNAGGSAFSGGSRVIQNGLIPARHILTAALGCMAAGSLIGIWFAVSLSSPWILALGMLGVFIAYAYTGVPLRLGYHGFGEILNFASFGPIMVLGAFAVQAPLWSWTALAASLPVGLLLAGVLVINEFPDHDSDRTVGKMTVVVLLGKSRALLVYDATLALPFLLVIAFAVSGIFPGWTLLALLSSPLAARAIRVAHEHHGSSRRLTAANRDTFLLHISFSALFAAGLFIG
jgi:1,4-dihydroxy-2-naphthoate octaprenyltransferase